MNDMTVQDILETLDADADYLADARKGRKIVVKWSPGQAEKDEMKPVTVEEAAQILYDKRVADFERATGLRKKRSQEHLDPSKHPEIAEEAAAKKPAEPDVADLEREDLEELCHELKIAFTKGTQDKTLVKKIKTAKAKIAVAESE